MYHLSFPQNVTLSMTFRHECSRFSNDPESQPLQFPPQESHKYQGRSSVFSLPVCLDCIILQDLSPTHLIMSHMIP